MVNIKKFPRGINSDQVISAKISTEAAPRALDPGLKQQAIEESVPYTDVIEVKNEWHCYPKKVSGSRG